MIKATSGGWLLSNLKPRIATGSKTTTDPLSGG